MFSRVVLIARELLERFEECMQKVRTENIDRGYISEYAVKNFSVSRVAKSILAN